MEAFKLYFSHLDRMAFVIYEKRLEPTNVLELIKIFEEGMSNFVKLTGVKKEEISTFVVKPGDSKNFKDCRVFHAKMKSAPNGALEKKANYTMTVWIRSGE